ncbi:Putative F0F1-ATPase subunit (ATPase_gene1) [Roseimaritima multifibrata]|uniref:F0F1-ATPase subunit (ATPase_gene1) n=1 Tax=Roseimaritima multifibrata TaxID=1930274 RepID=A0A517M8X4_9BACT|nr:AtpZ/AtpI family protein [Roseimaritima multifibrata]QDS91335.1 Putative F0F1-ATPase subunit (ATPase_gene1) [Roseimaritima multifibrata]
MSDPRRGIPPGRLVGLGMELAVVILVATGLGYLVDTYLLKAEQPWGLICGCLLGFAVGMTNVVRVSRNW